MKVITRTLLITAFAIEAIFRKILESVFNLVSSTLQLVSLMPMALILCMSLLWLCQSTLLAFKDLL